MSTTPKTYLSPEDRKNYQLALLDKLWRRNETLSVKLAEEWIQQRLKAGESLGMKGIPNPEGMKAHITTEMYFAGLDVCQAARKEVQS